MEEEKNLRSSEWVLIGGLLLILASLVFVSQCQRAKTSRQIAAHPLPSAHPISVTIRGAVAKPGIYWTEPGTSLRTVLRKSCPKRFADLHRIDLEQRIEEPVEITLKELTEIRVSVEGVGDGPQELRLPPGTRLCDLSSKVRLTNEADLSFFKQRRLLKDGDKIVVPKKRG